MFFLLLLIDQRTLDKLGKFFSESYPIRRLKPLGNPSKSLIFLSMIKILLVWYVSLVGCTVKNRSVSLKPVLNNN